MSEPFTPDDLRSEAQNEHMIDQHYLPTGRMLNWGAEEIERLRDALERIAKSVGGWQPEGGTPSQIARQALHRRSQSRE